MEKKDTPLFSHSSLRRTQMVYRPRLSQQYPPHRQVFHEDALLWLQHHQAAEGMSIITSLPDLSEVPHLGMDGWKVWFKDAAHKLLAWLPEDGTCIFFQSDTRQEGQWIPKGFWILEVAESLGFSLLWHKIVCRKPPGTITPGRASYSHMICVVPRVRAAPIVRPGPDVLVDGGPTNWRRGMGQYACREACRFLVDETSTNTVVDPFCGQGAVLAMANEWGLAAIGVELNRKRSEWAARFNFCEEK